MPGACERLWEVDAYRDGRLGVKDRASFERHLQACGECRRRMRSRERLRELGQALPTHGPSELGLRRLRARVLRDAAHGAAPLARVSWWRGIAVVAALACLALWVTVKQHRESARPTLAAGTGPRSVSAALEEKPGTEAMAAQVVASAGARWTQSRADHVERVELDNGALRVHVRHQVPGERFLVVLPDGELEVRGTTFEVFVEGGATTRVHVDEGVVDFASAAARPFASPLRTSGPPRSLHPRPFLTHAPSARQCRRPRLRDPRPPRRRDGRVRKCHGSPSRRPKRRGSIRLARLRPLRAALARSRGRVLPRSRRARPRRPRGCRGACRRGSPGELPAIVPPQGGEHPRRACCRRSRRLPQGARRARPLGQRGRRGCACPPAAVRAPTLKFPAAA